MQMFKKLVIEYKKFMLNFTFNSASKAGLVAEIKQLEEEYRETYYRNDLRNMFNKEAENMKIKLTFKEGIEDGRATTTFLEKYAYYRKTHPKDSKNTFVQHLLEEYLGESVTDAEKEQLKNQDMQITMQGLMQSKKIEVAPDKPEPDSDAASGVGIFSFFSNIGKK